MKIIKCKWADEDNVIISDFTNLALIFYVVLPFNGLQI
jgi:hypothetical protein